MCQKKSQIPNFVDSEGMLQELPLDVLLRILSLLSRDDLIQVGFCSHLLRLLSNQSLLMNNVFIKPRSNWIKESFFFDISQMDLEPIRHAEEKESSDTGNDDEQLLTDIYARPFMCNSEEVLTYANISQGVHVEDTTVFGGNQVNTAEHEGCEEIKLERSLESTTSPSLSDYSKSSANSLFSELPPRLSNDGWHSPMNELNALSDECGHDSSDCESTSSGDSLDKLRSSNKVRDKAALFEKLMTKDISHHNKDSQRKSSKGKSYGLLSNFLPDRSFNTTDRNVSQGYIEEVARCNGETPETANAGMNQRNLTNGLEIEFFEEESPKGSRRSHGKRTQRNRLKAFVTQENRICYEKI